MKHLRLYRLRDTAFATYGSLRDEQGNEVCVTLELPFVDADRDGVTDRNVSRVPAGTYEAFRRLSPGHGYVVFELVDVPGRDHVQMHSANLPVDLRGCIGLGRRFGFVEKSTGEKGDGILESRTAFRAFMAAYSEQRFKLTISDPPAAA